MMQVALLKLGLDWSSIQEMPLAEARALLHAYDRIVEPPTDGKKFKVKRS